MILKIYYDNHCPLCLFEMQQLKSHDHNENISLIKIHDANFSTQHPHINPLEAIRILHGQLNTGELLLGLDVTCKAWDLVGKHKWLKLLRWPVIRVLADTTYLFFARYRSTISFLLTGKKSCRSCQLKNIGEP